MFYIIQYFKCNKNTANDIAESVHHYSHIQLWTICGFFPIHSANIERTSTVIQALFYLGVGIQQLTK